MVGTTTCQQIGNRRRYIPQYRVSAGGNTKAINKLLSAAEWLFRYNVSYQSEGNKPVQVLTLLRRVLSKSRKRSSALIIRELSVEYWWLRKRCPWVRELCR